MPLPYFKIVNRTGIAKDTQVLYVDDEGEETQIHGIYRIGVDLEVGEMSRAHINLDTYAEVDIALLPNMVVVSKDEPAPLPDGWKQFGDE